MAHTNFESNVETVKKALKENYNCPVQIKKYNTGSYIYVVQAICNGGSLKTFRVTKYKVNSQCIGYVDIDRISYYGVEYDNSKIGGIPDSLIGFIRKFYLAVNR